MTHSRLYQEHYDVHNSDVPNTCSLKVEFRCIVLMFLKDWTTMSPTALLMFQALVLMFSLTGQLSESRVELRAASG